MSTKKFDEDFKKMIVQLHIDGAGVTALSKEYQVAPATIYKWFALYSPNEELGMTKSEILAMKKEMARIKEENEILKKAVSIFAQKSNQK